MSDPVFSESFNSLDRNIPILTQPFSQVLCVSDSDETLSEDNSSSASSATNREQALVDLTRISNSSNDLCSSRSDSRTAENTPCSVIEISDSANSSTIFNCSTINSKPSRISPCARNRLNDFFANIPKSVSPTPENKSDKITKSQSSVDMHNHRTSEDSGEVASDVTKSSDKTSSGSDQSKSEEDYRDMKNWNVNISANIKIKVHVSEIGTRSSSESEQESEEARKSAYKPPANNQVLQRTERFLDDDMMTILTEIYGQSWRTNKILPFCQPKQTSNDNNCKNRHLLDERKVSFLQCLDEKTPLTLCSEEALKYRTHYNSTKDKLMLQLYELYNSKIFENKLDIPCSWNKKLTCTAGRCTNIKRSGERFCKIELSEKVVTSAARMRSTLVHEMCHAATWIYNGENGHGKHWKSWTHRARRAFPELPPITVCHQYEIEYKYTYQCVLCRARYNAHTRSKKTESIRCAYCHGQIELFLNKKTKDGEIVATPAKKAKGFAAFVKKTYKQIRQNESNHAATMKILGEKFAQLSTEEKEQYA